jgi:hypothetical protein
MANKPNELLECMADIAPENRIQIMGIITVLAEAVTRFIANNTEALDRVAAATGAQNARMEALEKQIRLNTPMSLQQARYINGAIRQKARELLVKRGAEDNAVAIRLLSTSIRKAVLTRYGASTLTEIPRHEYPVTLTQVQTWNDALCVRDAAKAAEERGGKA